MNALVKPVLGLSVLGMLAMYSPAKQSSARPKPVDPFKGIHEAHWMEARF